MLFLLLIPIYLFSGQANALEASQIWPMLSGIDSMNGKAHCLEKIKIPSSPIEPTKDFLDLQNATETIKKASKSVLSICFCENESDLCSTVTSLGGGKFVTNEHVVEGLLQDKAAYEKYKGKKCDWLVAGPNGTSKKITLNIQKRGWWNHQDPKYEELDHTKDLSFIEIPELSDVPGLKMSTSSPRQGDPAFVLGYPIRNRYITFDRKPMQPALSSGKLTSIDPRNDTADFIGVNGMSGGPVLNSKGELIGIFWGKEPNKRDSSVLYRNPDGSWGLPAMMPRETSYFIPSDYVSKAQILSFKEKVRNFFSRD